MLQPEEIIKELVRVSSYAKSLTGDSDFRLFIQRGTAKIKKGNSSKTINVVCIGWCHYETTEEKEFAHSISNALLLTEKQVSSISQLSLKSMLPWKLIANFQLKSKLRVIEDDY